MLSTSLQDAINEQIRNEISSAYLYLAMSAHCDAVNLSGTATTALPSAPALSVLELPGHPGTIDVGTYYGVWTCSTCGGQNPTASWQRLGGTDLTRGALPKVEVDQLSVTSDNHTLIAWTHGRGIWQIGLGS